MLQVYSTMLVLDWAFVLGETGLRVELDKTLVTVLRSQGLNLV